MFVIARRVIISSVSPSDLPFAPFRSKLIEPAVHAEVAIGRLITNLGAMPSTSHAIELH
jgi:hypothetical protein